MNNVKYTLWFILLLNLHIVFATENNVCNTTSAYLFKTSNCWYDPDLLSSTPDIIARHGYPVTVYPVITQDGFILKVVRISHNGKNASQIDRQPVFLQHGMIQDSSIWVDIGNKSLAFVLSNLGYDVWMGNTRGTSLSNEHVIYNIRDKEFWDSTQDTFGHYDTPAVMDFIVNITKQKVIYIGHSQGTTQSYIYAIDNKTHAEKNVKGLISLAPVAYLDGMPWLKYIAPIGEPLLRILHSFGFYYSGFGEDANRKILHLLCLQTPLQLRICKVLLQLFYGKDSGDQWTPDLMPAIINNLIDRESILPTLQYFQMANSKNFEAFNYGEQRNLELYGQKTPTPYNLSKISVPVYLFYGMNDPLGFYKNVYRLNLELKSPKKLIRIGGKKYAFNHNHFVYSSRVQEELYPKLLPIIDELKRL